MGEAAGELDGGGRGAAADEFRCQAAAAGSATRRPRKVERFGQDLDAAVDLVRAQFVDGGGEGTDEQAAVLAAAACG